MEWFRGGVFQPEQDRNENMPRTHPHEASAESMASLCQRQQHCVKASIASQWQLAEAQDQLCGLELHSSESVEQERAQALASSAELSQTEHEWRLKETMLGRSPTLSPEANRDVFDKSIINISHSWPNEADADKSLNFVQHNEELLKHFGMLRRWDDSQRFLAEYHNLICEETSNYLILWCFRLQAEKKEALMEQVAHQAVVMQFILEMARNTQQDPRGCFRQFFQKAKAEWFDKYLQIRSFIKKVFASFPTSIDPQNLDYIRKAWQNDLDREFSDEEWEDALKQAGQEGYLDVFQTELQAFKERVKEYTMKSKGEMPKDTVHQNTAPACRLDPKEVLESLPTELKTCIQMQDMQILQNVLNTMNPQVAEYHVKRCLEAGLWTNIPRTSKDESSEADEWKMMET